MNEQLYNVSANPHVRDKASTHSIMLDVIIALLPATLFGFWNFGVKAIINTVICVAVCVLAEYVWQRCMHQKVITFGNVKTFDAIKKKLIVIDEHLQAVGKSEELDLEILESLRMILEMLAGLEREDEVNG